MTLEELGTEYARNLVSYHIIQDTINQATFIEKEGALAKRTVSDDVLMVSFGSAENGGGGMRSVYLNSEAHVLEFANPVDLAEDLETKVRWEKVSKIIQNMEDGREKEIIILRYGLNNKKPLTQREVAQRLNISRSYVSRIEKKILNDIKNEIE